MKVFIYYGNIVSTGSKATLFLEELIKQFKSHSTFKQVIVRTPENMDLRFMTSWNDVLADDTVGDREIIKKEMLESDLIIIISPVFLHNVSAYTKLFLDNFASWAHTMPLIGKVGIPISLSSNNGNQFVDDYLRKIMNYWGITTMKPMSLELTGLNNNAMNSYIRFLVENSIEARDNILSLDHSMMTEIYHSNWETMMNYNNDHPEKILFDKMGYSNFNSFEKVPLRCVIKKKIAMRSGETDKSVTVKNDLIQKVILNLANKLGHVANLDCDIIVKDEKVYIIDL